MENKRGQFYLLTAIAIIALVSGFATLANYTLNQNPLDFRHLKEELDIESEKMVDYILSNNLDFKNNLADFTHNYSIYSEADNSYFIFGDSSSATVSGYKKLEDGSIIVDTDSETGTEINLNENTYNSRDFSNPGNYINITVDGVEHDFKINTGKNFYFVISKEAGDDIQTFTNNEG